MIPQVNNVDSLTSSFEQLSLEKPVHKKTPSTPRLVLEFDAVELRQLLQTEKGALSKLPERVKRLFKNFGRTLQVLDLTPSTSQEIVDCRGLPTNIVSYCPNLRSLHLPDTNVGDDDLGAIGKFSNLRELGLASNPDITDVGIARIQMLGKLRYLNVSYCPKLTEKSFALIGKSFPKLRQLYLHRRKDDNVQQGFAKKVISCFEKLKLAGLGMNHCGVGLQELDMIAHQQWHNLGQLVVLGTEFSLDKLITPLRGLPCIQFLWVDLQEKIEPKLFQELCKWCPELTVLYMDKGMTFAKLDHGKLIRYGSVVEQVAKDESFLTEKKAN